LVEAATEGTAVRRARARSAEPPTLELALVVGDVVALRDRDVGFARVPTSQLA